MSAGTCRFCGCADDHACDGGCAWADPDHTICSMCQSAVHIAQPVVDVLGSVIVHEQPRRALRVAVWEDLTLEQQRPIVMACRATVEGMRRALLDGMTEDAIVAGVELNAIVGFLLTHCPETVQREESISNVVIHLLEPHVGSRIVLPGGGR